MLKAIQERLGTLAKKTWAEEMTVWGKKVALYREYYDGDHRAKMSVAMREMLNIDDPRTENFNANYCEMVVNTMVDRLKVNEVEGDNPEASTWSAEVLDFNRFDGLQGEIHEATVRDGDTFLMATWDNDAQATVMAHELAWDGDTGMMVVYDRTRKHIEAAVKIWYEGKSQFVNLYYPARVEKFTYGEDSGLTVLEADPVEWKVGVVPIIHYRNRARSFQTLGTSEEAAAIPLQDALNRTMVSMVMTAELTGFGMRYTKGFEPEKGLAPGVVVVIGKGVEDPALLSVCEIGLIEQADLVPFINQAEFLIDQIGTVTRTPLPGQMGGDAQSGEALKQRETGLLGKIGKFQVKAGNSWEDALALAHLVETTFGTEKPPKCERWQCRWQDGQVRNDAEVIANALAVKEMVGEMEFLRLIAPVYGWDQQKIEDIIREKREQAAANLSLIGLPGADRLRNAGGGEADEDVPEDAVA